MGFANDLEPLPLTSSTSERIARYKEVYNRIQLLLEGDVDWVAAMATVACELAGAFEYYHWTGFYRLVSATRLMVGPYQGGHGCLFIPVGKGVCGAAAASRQTQLVPDVHKFPGHIACASSTRSEVVVPVLCPSDGTVLAVLDVDSNHPAAFSAEADQQQLEALCGWLGQRYGGSTTQ